MSVTPVSLFSDNFTTLNSVNKSTLNDNRKVNSFDSIFNAAIDMYRETDSLQKAAESAEISFALGYTNSIHDVALAQQKANISLQYTTKITNSVVSAYKEIMGMQL
ncbi:MAG: flagellar hook-basal body complex protein FliE [Lachnospiraceae bacterium]|nr:flagellar hook-basal body complex protein FliE [Lachnospiraceae bacterium]